MFRPNFEIELVEEESCENNILLTGKRCSSLGAYTHAHARTDVPTYRGAPTHTHIHAGTHEVNGGTKKHSRIT